MEVLVAADVADGIEITGGMHYRDLLAVDLDTPGRPLRDLFDRCHPDRRDHAPPPAAGQNPTKTICILHRGGWGTAQAAGARPVRASSMASWICRRTCSSAIRSMTGWKNPWTRVFWASSRENPRLCR